MDCVDRNSLAGPSIFLRRPSVDQAVFAEPIVPESSKSGPQRPSSASSGSTASRALSNIVEASPVSSQYVPRETDLPTQAMHSDGMDRLPQPLQFHGSRSTTSMSLPPSSVPIRKSSRSRFLRQPSEALRTSAEESQIPPNSRGGLGITVSSRGRSVSPVRLAAVRYNAISSNAQRKSSRTFVRPVRPYDILEFPGVSHPRVSLDVGIPAPLCVGGGTVEGQISVTFDSTRQRPRAKSSMPIFVSRLAVDIIGVETSQGKNFIFRNLANELIDEAHPPPATMVAASRGAVDAYWEVTPSLSILPFKLDLPVFMGPPPYKSKHANIKYMLCATLIFKISGKQHYVRRSLEITVLSVHDRTYWSIQCQMYSNGTDSA